MPSWFRFKVPSTFPETMQEEVAAFAGPVYLPRANRIVAPLNAAWLVEQFLTKREVPFQMEAPRLPEPLTEIPMLPEVRLQPSGMEQTFPGYLMAYQKDAILKTGHLDGAHFWHSPGSGKTITAIIWGLLVPGLIVFVTRAGARGTIATEIRRVTTCSPLVVVGEQPLAIPPDTRFVVIGWENLPFHIDTILAAKPTTVIWDESHKGKNWKRWIAEPKRDKETGEAILDEQGNLRLDFIPRKNVANAVEALSMAAERRLATTASPIKDRVRDLWAQLDMVEPRAWARFYRWAERYCAAAPNRWGGIDTTGRAAEPIMQELFLRLSFTVHNVPYSVTHRDLPAKRRLVTYLGPELLSAGHNYAARKGEWGLTGNEAAVFAKLRSAADMKRKAAIERVVEAAAPDASGNGGGKVVVFTALRKDCEKFHAALVKALPKGVQTWMAHGDHSTTLRDEIREQYMAHTGPCVLVGTGDAWGESVNLQDTDHAFIVMLPWTPGQIRQWEGRFVRRGMRRPCLIEYLIAEGTYDEVVAQMLIGKLPSVERIVKDEELMGFGKDIGGLADEGAVLDALVAKLMGGEAEDDSKD